MLCKYCKKNQATKTYEQIKNGNRDVTYYCLDCYQKIFLDVESDGVSVRTDCPYCGTTVAELKKRNLVGCAKCYEVLASQLLPVITKMQGAQSHNGKRPFESEKERMFLRRMELKELVKKYREEKDYESARAYEERLVQLENGVEEDYVWRRLLLSKQS